MNLYYISFATETEFLGATVVEAISETQALDIVSNNGINPGGQAAIIWVPEELWNAPDIAPLKYKLFNREAMIELGCKRHGDLTTHQQLILNNYATIKG